MTLTSEHLRREPAQLQGHLRLQTKPLAAADHTVCGDTYRFTVLTWFGRPIGVEG
jgi:hypothetical protein